MKQGVEQNIKCPKCGSRDISKPDTLASDQTPPTTVLCRCRICGYQFNYNPPVKES